MDWRRVLAAACLTCWSSAELGRDTSIRANRVTTILFQQIAMRVPFTLGTVGHFGLAVRDPKKSARWFERALGLTQTVRLRRRQLPSATTTSRSRFSKVVPSPETIGHMSFHLPDLPTLRKALEHLKKIGAELEDPGDEIGPEAPGSPHLGVWFHDPDGYRWELSVQEADS